jgi:effector-binding domain-containing protein
VARVRLEKRKPMKVAYMQHFGSYSTIPFDRYIGELYGWAKKSKVMPGFYPMAIYMSDPKKTPPEKSVMEIAISFKGDGKPEGDIKIKDLPEMTVATYSHKGPSSEYQKSYATLTSWIAEKGYSMAGPPIEVYSKKPEMVNGQPVIYAKIMFPICDLKKA